MTKCLVVGSTGFLGSQLIKVLEDNQESYDTLDREKNSQGFSFENLEDIEETYSHIYVLAAMIPYGAMNDQTDGLEEANVQLPERIVQKFPASRLIYSSSISVYGESDGSLLDESSIISNLNAYAMSKLKGEKAILGAKDSIILRFSSLYGPGMKEKTFLPIIVKSALEKKRITLIGDSSRVQDYLHVNDAAQYLYTSSQIQANGVFNACFGKSRSNKEISIILKNLIEDLSINEEIGPLAPSYRLSIEKWLSISEFRPKIDLETGIKELIRYYSKS